MDIKQMEFNRNEDQLRMLVSTMKQRLAVIEQGAERKPSRKCANAVN